MKTDAGRGPVLCLAICETVLKNIRKKYLRISPKCWYFLIVVMSRNELGDSIVVDTGWFRMLWQHWKKWNCWGGTRCGKGIEARASEA